MQVDELKAAQNVKKRGPSSIQADSDAKTNASPVHAGTVPVINPPTVPPQAALRTLHRETKAEQVPPPPRTLAVMEEDIPSDRVKFALRE